MKIPDFLKKQLVTILVSGICMLFGIASYDFIINDGEALGLSQAETSEIVHTEEVALDAVKYAPNRVYRYSVQGDVLLTHVIQMKQESAAIPCGCAAAIPIPYSIDTVVETKKPTSEQDILALAKLNETLAKSYLIGQWLPGYKVKFITSLPDKKMPDEKTE